MRSAAVVALAAGSGVLGRLPPRLTTGRGGVSRNTEKDQDRNLRHLKPRPHGKDAKLTLVSTSEANLARLKMLSPEPELCPPNASSGVPE